MLSVFHWHKNVSFRVYRAEWSDSGSCWQMDWGLEPRLFCMYTRNHLASLPGITTSFWLSKVLPNLMCYAVCRPRDVRALMDLSNSVMRSLQRRKISSMRWSSWRRSINSGRYFGCDLSPVSGRSIPTHPQVGDLEEAVWKEFLWVLDAVYW